MRAVLSLACVLALASFGCGDNTIMLMDSGTGGTDTGMGGTDAPTAMVDAPTTPACPPEMAPPPAPDACAASTFDCLRTAGTQAAQMACIDADPNATACLGCLNQEIFATCTTGGMCADEFGLIQCCLEEACPTGDMACLEMAGSATGACATEVMGMIACVNTEQMAMRCGISQTLCFADAPAPSPFFPDFGSRRFDWSPREIRWSGVFAN